MNIQNKKVLITGGGSGIGFGIAKVFSAAGAHVILVGRTEERLKKSAASLKSATYITADVSNTKDVKRLVETVTHDGGIDILINSAGKCHFLSAVLSDDDHKKVREEMEMNFFAVVNVINQFLPGLKQLESAAIINMESMVAFAPSIMAATYAASKAAMRCYSQALRIQLEKEGSNIKVIEVFPPFADTEMNAGREFPKVAPDIIAEDIMAAVLKDELVIRLGFAETLYQEMLISPENAVSFINSF
ncbi:SDR family NAD(P)-dependent oxidoreductase [Pedobacter hartonius]|uniref:Uncharacterized oxidoreductase n=1 Tax=Pedobacter hartonius TaxID=425514 RepID=A0A1H4GC98_9SPHI|nr:SDR family NAD(P)-dependent oxidoreductase [Pedobacter hartonius]SEB07243.1 uncharacterized oxidoreductase [Pedobacter hartonius]